MATLGTPETHPLTELHTYHQNPRHGNVEAIAASLRANGQFRPLVVNRGTHTGRPMEVLAGNHTLQAARQLTEEGTPGYDSVDCYVVDVDEDAATRIVLADNRTADLGAYDEQVLIDLLDGIEDIEGTGYDQDDLADLMAAVESEEAWDPQAGGAWDGDDDPDDDGTSSAADSASTAAPVVTVEHGALARRFIQPPLTIINTRRGEWRQRQQQWRALGIESTVGRQGELAYQGGVGKYNNWYEIKAKALAANPDITNEQIEEQYAGELRKFGDGSGTSEFDPALAELLVTWFSAPGHHVLDPWAGGSVRGIVSAALGRRYTGIDLRPEQIDANRLQWTAVQDRLPTTGHLNVVADDRPVLRPVTLTPGPAADEALALYAATSSTPLRDEWHEPLPAELHHYLSLIYSAWEQPLDAEVDAEPTTPWAPLPDNRDECWVLFTGGKDSVAAALQAEQDGYRPVLFHVAGINRGMSDELGYARALAAVRGWRLVVERVAASGKKNGLIELPTKNQVTALLLLNRMAAEGANRWTAGWHTTDRQEDRGAGYDFSDGDEAIGRFDAYLSARFPGQQYLGHLTSTTEAWAEVGAAGLLRMVKGCVCPVRFKKQRREANEAKFGPLLETRCGSCVKCAWEQAALERLGLSEPRPEYDTHLHRFMEEAWPEQGDGVVDWLVPPAEAQALHRDEWPEQIDPATVVPADADEEPAAGVAVAVEDTAAAPEWLVGDSSAVMQASAPLQADMVIGCPPYYDLEEYSDNPEDLSNMTPEQFDAAMLDTLQQVDRHLAEDSFAVFVVAPVRNPKGDLMDMKMLMQQCGRQVGWHYINDMVLVNSAGSAAIRAARMFTSARTITRVHQDVVVFCKGDRKRAAERCGEVQVAELAGEDGEVDAEADAPAGYGKDE